MNDTKTIKTPNGHKVVIKSFVSKRDQRKIMSVMNDVELTVSTDGSTTPNIKFEKASELENATIESLVVSVDGKIENILDTILDMKTEDFDYILSELNDVQQGLKKNK